MHEFEKVSSVGFNIANQISLLPSPFPSISLGIGIQLVLANQLIIELQ